MADFQGEQEAAVISNFSADKWTTYSLDWLYDPNRFDHLPLDQQIALYKQRNLRKAKIFKLASTIWDSSYVRKRRFVAKSINLLPEITPIEKTEYSSDKTKSACECEERNAFDLEAEYTQWISERRKLREGLESLSVNELWLASKHSRTPMEEHVLHNLRQKRVLRDNCVAVAVSNKRSLGLHVCQSV